MRVAVNIAETGIWQKPLGLRRPGDPPAQLKVMLHVGRTPEGAPRFTANLTHPDNVDIEKLAVGEDLEDVLRSTDLRLDELAAMEYVAISEPARLTEGAVLDALPWALEYVDAFERDGVPPPLPEDWHSPAAARAPEPEPPPLSDPPASAADLPELAGEELRFVWDTSGGDTDPRTSILHEGGILWTEPARWEGISRFVAVVGLLRERYGERFAELAPTQRSWLYLYGDDMSAPQRAVNAQLPEIRDARVELEYTYEPDEHGEPRWTVRYGGRAILRDWFERPRYGPLTYQRARRTLGEAYRQSRVSMRLTLRHSTTPSASSSRTLPANCLTSSSRRLRALAPRRFASAGSPSGLDAPTTEHRGSGSAFLRRATARRSASFE